MDMMTFLKWEMNSYKRQKMSVRACCTDFAFLMNYA